MFGHLVPCSGGKSIELSRTSLYLGRRPDADRTAPLNGQTALCRLRFVDRWWHLDSLQDSDGLRVNGERCTSRRLQARDELTIGRTRYRIDYQTPRDQESSDLLEQIAESVLFDDRASESVGRASATSPAVRPAMATHPNFAALEQTAKHPAVSTTVEPGDLLGRLVPLGGGPDHPLLKPNVTVGRQPPCDVILRVGTVSSKHCELELIEGYWQVKDLGSRNGVRLDSVRCQQAWVFPKSRLSIADQRFRLDYKPDGEPPMPHPSQQPSLMAKAGLTGDKLERLMARTGQQGDDSERKRWELSEDV